MGDDGDDEDRGRSQGRGSQGEHTKERATHFSGARARRVDTRLGTVYLLVPKVRKGGYIPFFVSERRRSDQALIAVVQEAFINGVSTRKVERLARADESEDSWRVFFRKLKARGMKRTALCISDAHAGIQAAVRKEWLGASWPRCKVHFMRNITS